MIKKSLYVTAGVITFTLAVIGIVVRGIPTTPLMLLTLFLWSKGFTKMETWLKRSFFYKKFIQKYDERRALTLKEKISTQVFAAIMMTISFVLVPVLIVRIFLVLSLITMNYVFIFRIKTYKPELGPDFERNP